MKTDFFEIINSNQFINHDFKLVNNNSFNFDSIKTNNYKIIEDFTFEKDTLGKIFDIMNDNDNDNDTYSLIEHKLFYREKKNVFVFKKRKRNRRQLFFIEPLHNKSKKLLAKIKLNFTKVYIKER